MRSRWLRFALCVFFLPLTMVLAAPGVASAASSELVTIEVDGSANGGNATCTFGVAINAVTGGAQVIIGSGGYCKAGPDGTPGLCGPWEGADCNTVTVSVRDATGECGSANLPVTGSSGTVSKTMNLGSAVVSIPTTCDPAQICLQNIINPVGPDSEAYGCASTGLDAVEELEDPLGCDIATVTKPWSQNMRHVIIDSDFSRGERDWAGSITFNEGMSATPGKWIAYHVMWGGAGTTGDASTSGVNSRATRYHQVAVDGLGGFIFQNQVHLGSYFKATTQARVETAQGVDGDAHQIGVGYVWMPGTGPWLLNSQPANQRFGSFKIGLNDPENCAFYFGVKIADFAGEWDEPAGPLLDASEEVPPPAEPPVVDPPPEDTGFDLDFGWLAALLGQLIDAVVNLADRIIDGIASLFIPDEGFMDDRVEDLTTAWDDTSVAKYSDSITDISVGSVSGCSGLPLNVNLGGGVNVNENVGEACSGSMATAAGIVRAVMSALVVIGGCIACVRAVGSGFGWNPGIGQGTS